MIKNKPILLSIIFYIIVNLSFAQSIKERYKHLGKMYIAQLTSAPFPHSERANGYIYKGETYSTQSHYMDSSVAIFIPKNFKEMSGINFVVYFHGWRNNIDSSCVRFRLIEQFSKSNINAVFVFPEGPKNAPDSHGGKLEELDGLKKLIHDVLTFLSDSAKISNTDIGNIILAGHSGAYHTISFCLEYGGLTEKISDVLLFDALYGRTEIYLHWIKNFNGRFINIYTDNGGAKKETKTLMTCLDSLNIAHFKTEEKQLKQSDLTGNRLIFVHTDLNHNQVIAERNQFEIYLKSSTLKPIQQNPIDIKLHK